VPVGVPIGASAPRTAAAGGSPRRPRGAPASAQLAVHCRRPARLRDHAAALWQLCCRIGRTTTVAWQRVGPYARCHHLRPRATGSILGTNSRATQRAGEMAAADPAYRARLGGRLELAARSRPEILLCGASFGHEAERALVRGKLVGFGAIQRAVRRHAARASATPRQNTGRAQHHDGSTNPVSVLKSPPRSVIRTCIRRCIPYDVGLWPSLLWVQQSRRKPTLVFSIGVSSDPPNTPTHNTRNGARNGCTVARIAVVRLESTP